MNGSRWHHVAAHLELGEDISRELPELGGLVGAVQGREQGDCTRCRGSNIGNILREDNNTEVEISRRRWSGKSDAANLVHLAQIVKTAT